MLALTFGAFLVVTVVTYARIAPEHLYNVSHGGLAGGLGRGVMELGFPDAILAVPLALVAVDVLRTRAATIVAALAVALCLVTALPGVWDADDIDVKPVNALPAIGVALVVVLLVATARRLTTGRPRLAGDPLRVVLAAAIALATVPYLFAELGFYAPDPIMADEPTPGEPTIAAVHLGSHEGMDGALLALGSVLLSRLTPWFAGKRLAAATSTILAVLLAYGCANLLQDDWLEQVYKRGTSAWKADSFAQPQLSARWALVALVGIAVELLWFRRERGRTARRLSAPGPPG
jgi:hypothetical protein